MDLRDHQNLINNHGYDGYIAIYRGADSISMNNGDVVLVQNERARDPEEWSIKEIMWQENHRTTEHPLSQEDIEIQRARGSLVKTMRTCVGVPVKLLERIHT
jgi:hypothetical protein